VLVVEGNEINRLVAEELLVHAGATVELCNDGEEAVLRLERGELANGVDVVLMEVHLPRMDGLEATRRLRRHAAFHELPILSMSGNSLLPDRERCVDAGMNGHISKPFDPVALVAELQRWKPSSVTINVAVADEGVRDEPTEPSALSLGEAPALDTRLGLQHCGGDASLYRSVLGRFLAGYMNVAGALAARVDAAQLEDARRLAHTAKGLAATVGAEPVRRAAAAIEAALRSGGPPQKENLAVLAGAMARLVEAATAYGVAPHDGAPAPRPSTPMQAAREEDEAGIDELKRSLEGCEARATDLLRTHRDALQRRLGGSIEPLERAISNYDFDAALALLGT